GDIYSLARAGISPSIVDLARENLRQNQHEDPELVIADARYQSIARICDIVGNSQQAEPNRLTQVLDKVILNRWLGVPIFLFVM
ncbi:ferrous iron transport protein B, partial [Salmonella enterica subsp. enterica serovar Typhimurium]|nr:ferrous iron transport protein B [Salmonella enterica subsp. enterica serovar Typhimurium]